MKNKLAVGFIIALVTFFYSCGGTNNETQTKFTNDSQNQTVALNQQDEAKENPVITFVELGSVNCIPCKKMQPVMKIIEEKYG